MVNLLGSWRQSGCPQAAHLYFQFQGLFTVMLAESDPTSLQCGGIRGELQGCRQRSAPARPAAAKQGQRGHRGGCWSPFKGMELLGWRLCLRGRSGHPQSTPPASAKQDRPSPPDGQGGCSTGRSPGLPSSGSLQCPMGRRCRAVLAEGSHVPGLGGKRLPGCWGGWECPCSTGTVW